MALAETAELAVRLSLRDDLSAGMGRARGALNGLEQSFGRTRRSLDTTARNMRRLGLLAGAAAAGGIALAIRSAADFEASLNTINTVAKVTPERLAEIGDQVRTLSRDTGTALDDLTNGYYDLVSAGIDAADAQGVLTAANTLAIGGLSTTAESVDLLTTALNAYGFSADKAREIADGFAVSIALGKVTASELASTFAGVAAVASDAGIEIEELQAAYAALTAKGQAAGAVATNIRAAIVALQKPTGQLSALQEKVNKDYFALAREKGLATAYQILTRDARKHGVSLIELTGRIQGTQFALGVTGKNAKGYRDALDQVRAGSRGVGEAQRQMEIRLAGVMPQWNRLRARAKDIAITFGQALLPAASKVLKTISGFLDLKSDDIDALAKRLGELADSLVTEENLEGLWAWLGELPWDSIGAGLKLTAEMAGAAVSAFRSLPPDVQTGLLALLAANKLTGGLVSSVFRDMAGIALRSLTTINAGHVTVISATGAGPGVVAGGGSRLGGLLGGLLGFAAKVTLVGIAAGVALELGRGMVEAANERQKEVEALVPKAETFAEGATLPQLRVALDKLREIRSDDIKSVLMDIGSIPGLADVLGTKGLKEAQDEAIRILEREIASRERSTPLEASPGGGGIDMARLAEQAAAGNVIAERILASLGKVEGHTWANAETARIMVTEGKSDAARLIRSYAAGNLTLDELAGLLRLLQRLERDTKDAVDRGTRATRDKDTTTKVTVNTTLTVSAAQVAREVQRVQVSGRYGTVIR